ncbi:hypothetical protein ET445_15245 [Agromyces protaetiae]|uniref:Type IV toxin-antitoxin system AbiEi family antitoxin domain-containing protein n=1 Tax=Agromyces protaetiae TaxID=2509455 RepID=A0A4P6FIT0_9MICO|nr:hypothetical protein [Agromyces protaetiae]QAY74479.1 hypothetical protein ET445_15245 [Agromyces protaetiae]
MDLAQLPVDANGLIEFAHAHDLGNRAALDRRSADGSILRLRRGVYIEATRFAGVRPAEQHRLRALAAARQRQSAVFAGETAAIFHGLPFVGPVPDEIVLLSPNRSGRRRNGVIELARRGNERIEVRAGVRLTSVADTLVEVARRVPLPTALAMFDAALWVPRFGEREPLTTFPELEARCAERLPFPGSRKVAAVMRRATTSAETPLETISRWRFEEYGFPAPVLQFPVALPRLGTTAHLDFAWPAFGIWGEADGTGKYASTAVLVEEKRREDEVRTVTGWRCGRWGWDDAWRGPGLRDILLAAGLPTSGARRRT